MPAVIWIGVWFFLQDAGEELAEAEVAPWMRQLVKNKAGDWRNQEGLTGGRVVTNPAFVNFFPAYLGKPVKQGIAGAVVMVVRKQDSLR